LKYTIVQTDRKAILQNQPKLTPFLPPSSSVGLLGVLLVALRLFLAVPSSAPGFHTEMVNLHLDGRRGVLAVAPAAEPVLGKLLEEAGPAQALGEVFVAIRATVEHL
jgi:hypothetical protein